MITFARTRAMHQYYRDVFTRSIYLPEADVLPAHIVTEVLNFANTDIAMVEAALWAAGTELSPEHDKALKLMMCAITLANQAFDFKSQGQQAVFPAETAAQVISYVVEALQLSDNKNYRVAAIQILFRINEIDSAVFLISNHLSELSTTPDVLKILLLICLMEEDFNQAYVVIQQLTADPELLGEDAMALVMIVCGIYKLGAYPDSFIDFRPLQDKDYRIDDSHYEWLIPAVNDGKTTVLVACDSGYYYQHAVALLLSIYETNGSALNVHFHIYNCDEVIRTHFAALVEKLPGLSVSLSTERVAENKAINVHYACRRFIFLRAALEKITGPVLVLDADCLVRKNWHQVIQGYQDNELIFSHDRGLPLWEQIPAGFVYSRGGDISKRYFDTVARFIDVNLNSGNAHWFLDQIALSFAVDILSPVEQIAIGRGPLAELIDVRHSEEAFSWVVTTSKSAEGHYQDYKQALCRKYLLTA